MMVDVNPQDGYDDVTGDPVPVGNALGDLSDYFDANVGKTYTQIEIDALGRRVPQPITYDVAISQFVNRTPEEIKLLQNKFIKAGFKKIKPTGRLDTIDQINNFINAAESAWEAYSKVAKLNPNKADRNIGDFIDKTAAGGSGKGDTTAYETLYLTTKQDAIRFFNQTYKDWTGNDATPDKAEAFYKSLNAAEKQNVQVQKTTQTGAGARTTVVKAGEIDKETLALDIIGKDITVDNVGALGGALSTKLKSLDTLAADYNVRLDPNTRKDYLFKIIGSKTGIDDVSARLQKLSALQNPALAPFIESGYKPSEVLGGFRSFKDSFYEEPSLSPNVWDDADLKWVASQQKLPSYDEFSKYLGNKPGAEFTQGFRRRAATFSADVLNQLGLER
jgi:hypothetical protein